MPTVSKLLIAAGVAASLAGAAQAQTAPPIKPGLWEVQMDRDGGAAKMPDMSEQLKNMPPDQRKKMEAMMKERGIDMSGGAGKIRMCLDKESLNEGHWQGKEESRCKTDFSTRSSSSWKWHSSCTDPKSETDGEASFTNAENYVVKTSTTMNVNGQAKTSQSTIHSHWLGADCGDVKPISAMRQHMPAKKK